MARKRYYLFRYAKGHYRNGSGKDVYDACHDAFGTYYSPSSTVKYKDLGTRSPAYLSQKAMKEFYSDKGWLDIPAR